MLLNCKICPILQTMHDTVYFKGRKVKNTFHSKCLKAAHTLIANLPPDICCHLYNILLNIVISATDD